MKQLHIPILSSFDDFKFNLGKRTIIDFLKGDLNPTIEKNNLDELNSYGCLYMIDKTQITDIVDLLMKNGFLESNVIMGGFQVIKRTAKGTKEIYSKKFDSDLKLSQTSSKLNYSFKETIITDDDKKVFAAFDFFLKEFNDEQKKAIISPNQNLLCIAGAGSGKTTVLTKRIDFLTKFRGVKQNKILAITFTRKAKEEMQTRLEKLSIHNVEIETFNSFCEKILKRYGNLIYEKDVKVAQYKDKILTVRNAIRKAGTNFEIFFDDYFNKRQIREKSPDELFFIFVNDIFTIIDFYKNAQDEIKPFYELEKNSVKKRIAKLVHNIAKIVQIELKKKGLRDFSDQIIDTLELFKANPQIIPQFEYVLVDEFQDVNLVQVELLKLLNSKNIFAVGDPRQAIYGWRGSEIKFILEFSEIFKGTEVIQLKKNYRSSKKIVKFFNHSIESLGLVGLEPANIADGEIFLVEQDSELLEKRFILEAIKNSKNLRNEIFILARTNRILESYAQFFARNNVRYAIKSEEEYKNAQPKDDEVVLATVHSIKGMEAKEVYVVSANNLSFPNKVADNFVFSLIKSDNEYDKQAEELRLFYVAISRAKEKLIITYTGNFSKFISKEMLETCEFKAKNKNLFEYASKHKNLDTSNNGVLKNILKDWRSQKAKDSGLPAYMIISNSAIEDLARIIPQNKIEMHNVNGMGDVKIAKYGDELLKVING